MRRNEAKAVARIVHEKVMANAIAHKTFMGVPLDEFEADELRDIILYLSEQLDWWGINWGDKT